ncbi:ankyrin repeat-containing protein bda1 [Quercus suber]|uniref:Ankyrin repeat-containing protein bda1 n=1 Tax=Quercus suber TaxID=58331 RepID=A0AAW0KGY4_QUESU
MDPRLSMAAQLGDVITLKALLEEDPLILEKVSLAPFAETPLHIATLAGKTEFVKEILSQKPSFASELNQDGFSPLHIAAASGQVEIVRELLKLSPELSLVKDKSGRTPLHFAAIRGRVFVIDELLSHCPRAIRCVTSRGETALHLAVKNNQFEALKALVEKLDNDDDDEILNAEDKEGNTILQLAVANNQLQLDKKFIEILPGEQSTVETDILPQATTQAGKFDLTQPQQSDQSAEDNSNTIWESVQEMVLVVASLIATVTYQAGLSPPQTIWKEDKKLDPKCIFHRSNSATNTCPSATYYLFMSFNTAGFFSSVFLIFFYGNKTYVKVLLPIALISMMITYITLSVTMLPNGLSLLIVYLITVGIFAYCVLAIEVVNKIIQSIYGFAAERVGHISTLARRKWKPSSADSI